MTAPPITTDKVIGMAAPMICVTGVWSGVAWRPASVRATSLGAMKNGAKTASVINHITRMPRRMRRTRNLSTTPRPRG
ncbi:MAG: hypothetical protein ABIQ53_10540 [Terracoccus sp.]